MSKTPKRSKDAATGKSGGGKRRLGGGRDAGKPRISRLGAKRPIFMFVALFAVLLGVFYALTFLPVLQNKALPALQVLNAKASVVVMNIFGEGASARKTTISSPRYSINIAHGCDAIEPTGLFIAAVLAFPAGIRSKFPGLLLGTGVLLTLNLVRIISLFYTGVYWPRAFEVMHEDVWQPAFVLLSLLFWITWALWATNPKVQPADASD